MIITDEKIDELLKYPEATRALLLADFQLLISVLHFLTFRTQWIFQPFHRQIADKLQSYVFGTNEKQNLYIGMPPRAGKSQLTVYFIVYAYLVNPACNFIYTSYSSGLCRKYSKQIRDILSLPFVKTVFGIDIDRTTSAQDLWKVIRGGEFRAIAMGGSITGFGAGTFEDKFGGAVMIDDFMKADDYRYKTRKNSVIEIFENTLKSRKNRPNKDPTIIIAQRLAVDDLINYIKENEPENWDFFVIPAFDEETGTSFWEERYPVEMLQRMRERNAYLYYSQYQQNPQNQNGGVIKKEWWRFYREIDDTPYSRIFITADTASKTKEWNDFTAISVWGLTIGNRLRLLDLVHGKFEIPELEATMLATWNKWAAGVKGRRCTAIYIEDKSSGTQLIQSLKRKGGLPIMSVVPEKDKYTRVLDAVPQIAAGNVELPAGEYNQITKAVVEECSAFAADGSHAHDDIVDTITMAVSQAFNQTGYF